MVVGLPQVLCPGADMRFMIVLHDWVIVLVRMSGRHVFPLSAVPEIVHDVSVLVCVNDGVMGVLHGLPSVPCYACGNLLEAPGRAGLADGGAGLARGWLSRCPALQGLVLRADGHKPLAAPRQTPH